MSNKSTPRPYETNSLNTSGTNRFLIIGLLVIGLIGASIWWLGKNKTNNDYVSTGLIQSSDPIYGKKDSKLKAIVVEDFFCPHCRDDNPVFDAAISKYSDQVEFVYKPINVLTGSQEIIPYAMAANAQGKYQEFSDLAFQKNDQLYNARKSTMQEIAKSIPGLNYDTWYDQGTNNLDFKKKAEQNKADLKALDLPAMGTQEAKPVGRDFPGTPGIILMSGDKITDWWTGSIGTSTQSVEERLKLMETRMQNAYGSEFTVK